MARFALCGPIFRMLLLCIIGGAVIAACTDGGAPTRLTAAESGDEISVDAGDRIEIVLESNPSTGYSWSIDAGTTDVVTLVSSKFEAADSDLTGAAGTETFVFEAPAAGAGIVRLVYVRPFDDPPIPDRIVEYIISIDGIPWTRDPSEPPLPSTATAPDGTDPQLDTISVAALFDGEGPRTAVVEGFVLVDSAGARLCETLMESFPPQCGGLSVVIANPSGLGATILAEAQGIQWTDQTVSLAGRFDGDRFILDTDADTVAPTAADEALVGAFLSHAEAPTDATAEALPFAEAVALGMGTEVLTVVPRSDLADNNAWSLDVDEHAGFSGPFSALDTAAAGGPDQLVEITIGAHPHCAGPPKPAPNEFEGLRRVSIQPTTATSCIEWWTIDFFVDDSDVVQAVTLDFFGP